MQNLKRNRFLAVLAAVALLGLTGVSVMAVEETEDDFWSDEEFFEDDDLFEATGSGGGPSLTWFDMDFSTINEILEGEAALLGVPENNLYWGGSGWGGMRTGERTFVAIGGGGFGGGSEALAGGKRTKWSHTGGYFSLKGIFAAHSRIFLEGGLQIGGGNSHIWAETQEDDGDIVVKIRGDRNFVLLRPHAGVDIRLARWVGILVEGGYSLSSGSWNLDGNEDLIDELDLDNNDGPYASVMVRFGI
jgi:hypothetical protein